MSVERTIPGEVDDVAEITRQLAMPFDPQHLKFKPGPKCPKGQAGQGQGGTGMGIAYLDARAIMERLDDVLGIDNWHDRYEVLPDGNVVCHLSLRLRGEWITKSDVGGQSEQPDDGDKMKAGFSDALKRAAVKWRIGRYVYWLPKFWLPWDGYKFTQTPKLPPWATPDAARPITQGAAAATPKALPPKNAPAPAQAPASHTPPKNGEELAERLAEYEAKLVRQGLCATGELVAFVQAAGERAGYVPDMTAWPPASFALAGKATKDFEARCRQRKTPAGVN